MEEDIKILENRIYYEPNDCLAFTYRKDGKRVTMERVNKAIENILNRNKELEEMNSFTSLKLKNYISKNKIEAIKNSILTDKRNKEEINETSKTLIRFCNYLLKE